MPLWMSPLVLIENLHYIIKKYFSFPEMSFTLTSLNEAFAMEPNSECSVALKVIEIGDTITYKNQQGQERSYYVMKVADEVHVTAIRNYQVRSKTLVNAGKTYSFLNIIRLVGFGFNDPLRQYFSLYRAVPEEREKEERKDR